MKKILVVDDEINLRHLIRKYLEKENYLVAEAEDGEIALEMLAKEEYDLVILDVMMPKVDGWTVGRTIRDKYEAAIIFLSARSEEYDKIFGFELGADDYVLKPFSPRELVARAKAVLKRKSITSGDLQSGEVIALGNFKINLREHVFEIDDMQIAITPKEFELLNLFLKNPGRVFSRAELLERIWHYEYFGSDRTIDTHIKFLRNKLKPYQNTIQTVWGIGYKFIPEVSL